MKEYIKDFIEKKKVSIRISKTDYEGYEDKTNLEVEHIDNQDFYCKTIPKDYSESDLSNYLLVKTIERIEEINSSINVIKTVVVICFILSIIAGIVWVWPLFGM